MRRPMTPHFMTRRQLLASACALPAALMLHGCGGGGDAPGAVRWGKENCAYCGMIIDDPRFAAQIRDGRKLNKFDDIGCATLFLHKNALADKAGVRLWVGDSDGGDWLDGRAAWFLAGRKSPMGYDWGAVAARRDGAVDFPGFQTAILTHGSNSRCETPERRS